MIRLTCVLYWYSIVIYASALIVDTEKPYNTFFTWYTNYKSTYMLRLSCIIDLQLMISLTIHRVFPSKFEFFRDSCYIMPNDTVILLVEYLTLTYFQFSDWLERSMACVIDNISHCGHNDCIDDKKSCKLPNSTIPCTM